MTLADLKPGQSGKILKIRIVGNLKRRLMDMGIIAGTPVRGEKVAPLGDPIEVHIKGYQLSLRKDEADKVEMEAD